MSIFMKAYFSTLLVLVIISAFYQRAVHNENMIVFFLFFLRRKHFLSQSVRRKFPSQLVWSVENVCTLTAKMFGAKIFGENIFGEQMFGGFFIKSPKISVNNFGEKGF